MTASQKPGAGHGGALNDPDRLEALKRTGLLDSPPEEVFDRLTRLACRLLGVPVALVSLVEADRQFFKSAVGLPDEWAVRRETPLSHSFCQHVVRTGAPLVVQDAGKDPLVSDNLAVPDLGVVAYLGMPLTMADGQVLGSLCAIDTEPRFWTPADAAALRDLAAMAVSEIALRRVARDLRGEGDQAWQERAGRLEALGQIVGGVAQDFAKLLQAVRSGVRMAGEWMESDPAAARGLLDSVGAVAERGTAATRLLLSVARHGRFGVQQVAVPALLKGLEDALEEGVDPAGAPRIRVEMAEDLPALLADRGELESVLAGLAANARDAMPGGGTLVLAAAAECVALGAVHPAGLRPGRYVRLSVADDGAGMEAAVLARAAEPFFTTKAGGSTGLGLSMARDFAAEAGGGLTIASRPGEGTTVTLWLPCAAEPAPG